MFEFHCLVFDVHNPYPILKYISMDKKIVLKYSLEMSPKYALYLKRFSKFNWEEKI